MKSIARHIAILALFTIIATASAQAQLLKMNAPAILCGSPNIGYEHQLTDRLSASGDIIWLPYMSDKHEEVFRSLQVAGEVRYYFKELEEENFLCRGWYAGGYAMWGNFNIGKYKHNDMDRSFRDMGWGVSAGITGGWKYQFKKHWQVDINMGIGYAYLQYHKYKLGGAYKDRPMGTWRTRNWFGPTRFSVSVGYIIDFQSLKKGNKRNNG